MTLLRERLARGFGAEADTANGRATSPLIDQLQQQAADLEADNAQLRQDAVKLKGDLREANETLEAARAMNRELMAEINRPGQRETRHLHGRRAGRRGATGPRPLCDLRPAHKTSPLTRCFLHDPKRTMALRRRCSALIFSVARSGVIVRSLQVHARAMAARTATTSEGAGRGCAGRGAAAGTQARQPRIQAGVPWAMSRAAPRPARCTPADTAAERIVS